ncbi:hypothetical protein F511_37243 [Dorcoceras hygrometricum]|uniref:Uncharacterized protein n=1 Tax=Dorcoceras hygrometricum TaxID=472368 RepID=A0A2Z7AT82_9LAMI|nr:hypothetical protein F511_37243 [Dorcoceras hygrometricum]
MQAISRKKKQLSQRSFVDAFAPIFIFIEPVQDLDSRKPYSGIVQRTWAEICVDIVQFSVFGHLLPHRLEVEGFYDFFVQPEIQYISSSSSSESSVPIIPRSASAISFSSSYSASRMDFTDEIPQTSHIAIPNVFSSTDYTESFAQLRASVDRIQLEQVRTRNDVAELKAALSSKITDLEMTFSHSSTHQEHVIRNQIFDVQQEIKTQKAALSQDLNDFRKETHEGINTLSAQLSEIIAYINRVRDDKKGKRVAEAKFCSSASSPEGVIRIRHGSPTHISSPPSDQRVSSSSDLFSAQLVVHRFVWSTRSSCDALSSF